MGQSGPGTTIPDETVFLMGQVPSAFDGYRTGLRMVDPYISGKLSVSSFGYFTTMYVTFLVSKIHTLVHF